MDIFSQLTRDEALRLKPYRDSVGKLTIGVGRNLDDKGISAAEAGVLLSNDVAAVQAALKSSIPWAYTLLSIPRQGVLENMAFNMGPSGLLSFHNTLTLVQSGKYSDAADAMLQSKWATQVGPRATRLAQQMKTGEWV